MQTALHVRGPVCSWKLAHFLACLTFISHVNAFGLCYFLANSTTNVVFFGSIRPVASHSLWRHRLPLKAPKSEMEGKFCAPHLALPRPAQKLARTMKRQLTKTSLAEMFKIRARFRRNLKITSLIDRDESRKMLRRMKRREGLGGG